MTVDNIDRERYSRNPRIARALADLGYVREQTVERYMMRGRGGIFVNGKSKHGPCPMDLAAHLSSSYSDSFEPWRERLNTLTEATFEDLVQKVPLERMSEPAREFVLDFLRISRARLLEIT